MTPGSRVLLPALAAGLLATSSPVLAQRPLAARSTPLDLVCGPHAAVTPPAQQVVVTGGTERAKSLFGPGESIVVNAGTSQGLRVGHHFYVRRVVKDRFALKTTEATPVSIHTAGWVTIVEANADVAVARVSEACDGILAGDYLEPMTLPPAPGDIAAGEADFGRPAHVILGGERRQLGGETSLMIIDRGSDHGLRPGQRLTIFRLAGSGESAPIIRIGEAVIATTRPDTSVMRIERSREAIQVGDKVAIHR